MIELIVNGTPYTDFITADVTVSLDSLANNFSFSASSVSNFPPIKKGYKVVAIVEGQAMLTGFISEINGQDQEGNHVIIYTGRDRTGDFIDSSINVIDDIRAGNSLTLKQIIESVISHLDSDLAVIDLAEPAVFNEAEDIITPEVGENSFDFVMKYAKKRQVLLSSNADGDIVITNSSPIDSGAVLQSLRGQGSNNILTQSWVIDDRELFNKYISRGQLDPTALNFAGSSSSETVEDQSGIVTDSDIRKGRQRVMVETESYSSQQLQNRALWSSQLSKSKSIRYSCASKDHRNSNGDLWAVNTLAQINSDVADINRKLLLNSVTFSQGEGQPTVSSLNFVDQNIYTIQAAILAQKPVGDFNTAFGG